MESINIIYAYDLINKTKGKIFTAVFRKKDHTLRFMNCRLGVKKGLTGKGMKYYPPKYGLINVYDMQKHDYRSINLMELIQLKVNHKTYSVHHKKTYLLK